MQIPKTEEELIKGRPIDKIINSKDLRFILECIMDKDLKTARTLSEKLFKQEDLPEKNLGEYLIELVDVLKAQLSGKDIKPIYRNIDNIIILEELNGLFPTDEITIEEIRTDIKKSGILVPLICQSRGDDLLLIDGHTRYNIAKELGIKKVPVVILDQFMGDPKLLAIIINIKRRHLSIEQRDVFISKLPIPKAGRPKKRIETLENAIKSNTVIHDGISATLIAKEEKVSKRTVERARQRERAKKLGIEYKANNPKPKDIVEEIEDFAGDGYLRHFTNQGFIQSRSFWLDFPFPPSDEDVKDAHKQLDSAIGDMLDFVAKNNIQDEVEKFEMKWSVRVVRKEKE